MSTDAGLAAAPQSPIRLTWAYVAALSLIAALVIAQAGFVHVLLSHQELDAGTINLAGRQRMLSQKIAKQMLTPPAEGQPLERATQLQIDVRDWETAHHRLRGDDAGSPLPRNSAEVERLFGLLDPHFMAMISAAHKASSTADPLSEPAHRSDSIAVFLEHEGQYLTLMNEIVFAYEREARARVQRLQSIGIGLSAAILLILLLEAFLIFRPIVARVRQTVEALAAAKRSAEELSLRDGLTGISNRRHFDSEFEREYRRSARVGTPIAALMLDLDNFKTLNDRTGHQAGDICLARVAKALAEQMRRPGDFVARYGGDEFVVCLPDTTFEGANAVAARLQRTVEDLNISIDGSSEPRRRVSVSAGIAAEIPSGLDGSPLSLIKEADQALYQNKTARRRPISLVSN